MPQHTPNPQVHAIIPAAGFSTNKLMLRSELPDTMMPINGRPVIAYILDDLLKRCVKSASIVLNHSDNYTERYVSLRYAAKMEINFVYNDKLELGVGHSVHLGCTKRDRSVLVILGDTIYTGHLNLAKDLLVVAPYTEYPKKWCFVRENDRSLTFIDRPHEPVTDGRILAGVYHFSDAALLKRCSKTRSGSKTVEMSDILTRYGKVHHFTLINASGWYDCGNIENYYKAKIDFLKLRKFNQVAYNDLYGTITKWSQDRPQKIRDEIEWYRKVPAHLRIFSPRIVDYVLAGEPKYSIEFYGYQSLADLFVFETIDESAWKAMLRRLFEILREFEAYGSTVALTRSQYDRMLTGKVRRRLAQMEHHAWYAAISSYENLVINGKKHHNLKHFSKELGQFTKTMFETTRPGVLHGDLCLSNILYDPTNRIFKFIDPRGNFGKRSVFGDVRYDIAKLRHSFVGGYDFLVAGLFSLSQKNNVFDLTIHSEKYNANVAQLFEEQVSVNGYDQNEIKVLEALLFLSMIPLHTENTARQKAMYLIGIQRLNEAFLCE